MAFSMMTPLDRLSWVAVIRNEPVGSHSMGPAGMFSNASRMQTASGQKFASDFPVGNETGQIS